MWPVWSMTATASSLASAASSDAAAMSLMDKHDLGLHTEMLTNSIVDLMEAGVLNNRKKNFITDGILYFALVRRSSMTWWMMFRVWSFTADPKCQRSRIIGQNDHFISINLTAVDLTGQVCLRASALMYSGTVPERFCRGRILFQKGGRRDLRKATKKKAIRSLPSWPSMRRQCGFT